MTTRWADTPSPATPCWASAAGGTISREPQDHGFMYGHAFEDLDGHIWEIIYMEPDEKGQV
jgi:predicted lactoylglutathione lyase